MVLVKQHFFNCIMGFEDYSGEVIKPVNVATVFDESHLYSNLNAFDNIALLVGKNLGDSERELLLKYIDESVLNRKVKSYSLGQKKILAILIAMFTNPQLLILDEVSNGLDYDTAKQVKNLLIACKKETLILVCGHQFDFYNQILDEVFVINDKKLVQVDINDFTDLEKVYEKFVG
ncbi:multidrug ABC transporter ATPase [Listeria weihenstephanensis FSL R9-0317]|uniref:ATP-binding cassette domain-containing protein n=1 Tax=Listeria weihenstephanensis TaxID=1006155 RepID=UPI0003E8B0AD|nr:ATP-binding cassette domain-containing protein [Listeria weihenstephanensis]EUJ35935.1 multidrug ABC transporter ATPase [Listeria weihenstephanensis FSL R9-0317]